MSKMEYFKDVNFFLDWVMYHDISTSECHVWQTLMLIGNKLGRKTIFNVPTSTLVRLTGLSRKTIIAAREKLSTRGFIKYQKGTKNQAPIYEMMPIHRTLLFYNNETPTVTQEVTQRETPWVTIHKEKEKVERRGRAHANEIFLLYEKNIGNLSPIIEEELNKWLPIFNEDVLEKAIKEMVKKGGKTFSYLEKILKQWQVAQLGSLTDVENFLKEQEGNKRKNVFPFRKQQNEKTPTDIDQLVHELLEEEV